MATSTDAPLRRNLEGILGDDVYWTFEDFTVDYNPYPVGVTAAMYMELASNPAVTNFTISGAFDANDRTKIVFKLNKANNTIKGKYNYDIKVTFPNTDVFTHIMGTVTIKADVKNDV